MQCEDEWSEMRQRFKKEGLDADTLKLEDRLLQVWRWLVDAESNLRNSRRMLDKLYEQQHEEIEEMENYVGKMKKLAEKRATDVEAECSVLKQEKTEILELLEGFGALGDSIYEKVLYLGEEKVKAAEDLEILKNMKLPSNGVNTDILTEMIKVSSEKESLKREVTEMRERVHLLEKSSRQLEIDNDRLSFKVASPPPENLQKWTDEVPLDTADQNLTISIRSAHTDTIVDISLHVPCPATPAHSPFVKCVEARSIRLGYFDILPFLFSMSRTIDNKKHHVSTDPEIIMTRRGYNEKSFIEISQRRSNGWPPQSPTIIRLTLKSIRRLETTLLIRLTLTVSATNIYIISTVLDSEDVCSHSL